MEEGSWGYKADEKYRVDGGVGMGGQAGHGYCYWYDASVSVDNPEAKGRLTNDASPMIRFWHPEYVYLTLKGGKY